MSTAAPGTRPPWTTRRPPAEPAARPLSGWRLRYQLLGALASGLMSALAFPPVNLWPLAVPAVALLALLCRYQTPRRAALLGLVHGLAVFLPLLEWMRVIGVDAWIMVALLEAAFLAAMGAALAVVGRLPLWPVWAATLWVAQELARGTVPFGGFPWGRLAFAQTGSPFTAYAALGGAPLVTFATALAGTLLASVVVNRRSRAVAVVALFCALGVPVVAFAIPTPVAGRPVTVALVQGGVAQAGLDFLGEREEVLRKHVAATRRLAADISAGRVARPDLVIWPENASDLDPFTDQEVFDLINGAVRAVGVPVLVGAVLEGPGPDHVSNAGIVWSPDAGPGERYVKRHPVPFGEYIPFRAQLSGWISRLDQIPRDFFAGPRPGAMDIGPTRVGDVICFEIAYDGVVRDVVDHDAKVLVVQTNNATYNGTSQPEQQLAMSRLRAVEHGRAVLVAATSGISAVVSPTGKVRARTDELTSETLVAQIPLRSKLTVATRVGSAPEWLLAAIGIASTSVGGLVAWRDRKRP